jgi:hypothetical protein
MRGGRGKFGETRTEKGMKVRQEARESNGREGQKCENGEQGEGRGEQGGGEESNEMRTRQG